MFATRWALILTLVTGLQAPLWGAPIAHEKFYPALASRPAGKSPGVIVLHSSGGYKSLRDRPEVYVKAGYVVYTPDFFDRHGLHKNNRFETWTVHREAIETELKEIIEIMRQDPVVDASNIFAVGYSNGGYWAAYLAASGLVKAGAVFYGVWNFPGNSYGYPASYFKESSHPLLALVGRRDSTQRYERVVPQVSVAQRRSPRLVLQEFDAEHSWDCSGCPTREAEVTRQAIEKTLSFFKEQQ